MYSSKNLKSRHKLENKLKMATVQYTVCYVKLRLLCFNLLYIQSMVLTVEHIFMPI